jgi:methyl-accepting chemotaxis protein
MNALSKLKLSHRLMLGFGLVLALVVCITGLALSRMQALSQTLDDVVLTGAERSHAITAMERGSNDYALVLHSAGGAELSAAEAHMKLIDDASARYDRAVAEASALMPATPKVAALMKSVADGASAMRAVMDVAKKSADGRGVGATFFYVRSAMTGAEAAAWDKKHETWRQALVALSDWDAAENRSVSVVARADARNARVFLIVGALAALALGSLAAWWIIRDLSAGVRSAVDATQRMAGHDLSNAMTTHRHDELGQLTRALEEMRCNLHSLASGVREACHGISTASREITQGSQNLSQRTEETASTLQETSSTIAQLMSMLDQTVSTAGTAGRLARDAQDTATRGGGVVSEAVSTMQEIDGASRKIADIIAIIDGIAFQTNILALNAAVEAARAGEQGRGFAVVAGEVRALAQRSATAAREIKGLIQASLDKVQSGSAQVKNAGGATTEIMGSVERVSELVTTLSAEATQQRDGVGQTGQSVAQLDTMAQQNAALAEESAAAAASLLQQAQRLAGMVDRFKLSENEAAAVQ